MSHRRHTSSGSSSSHHRNPLAHIPPLPELTEARLAALVFSPRLQSSLISPNTTLQNQRLEWLGDSILNFMITLMLDALFPSASTYIVAVIRADITSNRCFGTISKEYGLIQRVMARASEIGMKAKEMKTIGVKPKSHADVFEAYIGAICKDRSLGLGPARIFVDALFKPLVLSKYEDVVLQVSQRQERKAHNRNRPSGSPFVARLGMIIAEPPPNARGSVLQLGTPTPNAYPPASDRSWSSSRREASSFGFEAYGPSRSRAPSPEAGPSSGHHYHSNEIVSASSWSMEESEDEDDVKPSYPVSPAPRRFNMMRTTIVDSDEMRTHRDGHGLGVSFSEHQNEFETDGDEDITVDGEDDWEDWKADPVPREEFEDEIQYLGTSRWTALGLPHEPIYVDDSD